MDDGRGLREVDGDLGGRGRREGVLDEVVERLEVVVEVVMSVRIVVDHHMDRWCKTSVRRLRQFPSRAGYVPATSF